MKKGWLNLVSWLLLALSVAFLLLLFMALEAEIFHWLFG